MTVTDTGGTASPARVLIDRMFAAVIAKDMDGLLATLTEDAILHDPHYPNPHMVGKAAVKDGLNWGFSSMKSFSFPIVNYLEAPDGSHAAVEVATAHVLKMGMKLNFPQAFFFDIRDGLISRIQAYEPYGPNGVGGLFLGITRIGRKISRR